VIKGNSIVAVGKPKTHTTIYREPKRKAEDSRERREERKSKLSTLLICLFSLSLSPHGHSL
jgi:hypothetical protein